MKKVRILLILIVLLSMIGAIVYFNDNTKTNREVKKKVVIEEQVEDVIEEPKRKELSLVMVGDALIHDSIYKDASLGDGNYDFMSMFTDVGEIIKDYDLRYYNQETIIGGKNLGLSNYPLFNSPDEIGSDLVKTGFNMVSLANNHSLDKGEVGLNYSINFWNSLDGVITAGSYASWEDRENIKIHEVNGIKFAFLSYTTGTNGLSIPSGKEYLVNVYDEDKVKEDIEKIKDDVDLIIVAMHWGSEYTHTPTKEEKEIAKYLSSLGVNLIIGCHPHVIQPVDYVGDTLVIYSLGNFISSQRSLGLNKIIGLLVGLNIVVEDDKVTFEDLKYELLFTYDKNYRQFKIIPFSKLNNEILNNYEQIEEEYMNIVNSEVYYD